MVCLEPNGHLGVGAGPADLDPPAVTGHGPRCCARDVYLVPPRLEHTRAVEELWPSIAGTPARLSAGRTRGAAAVVPARVEGRVRVYSVGEV